MVWHLSHWRKDGACIGSMSTWPAVQVIKLGDKGKAGIIPGPQDPFSSCSLKLTVSFLTDSPILSVLCVLFPFAAWAGSCSTCLLYCIFPCILCLSEYRPHLNQASQRGQKAPVVIHKPMTGLQERPDLSLSSWCSPGQGLTSLFIEFSRTKGSVTTVCSFVMLHIIVPVFWISVIIFTRNKEPRSTMAVGNSLLRRSKDCL